MKYCQHCGKELLDEAVICVGCGRIVQAAQPIKQKINLDKMTQEIKEDSAIKNTAVTPSKDNKWIIRLLSYFLPCYQWHYTYVY